LSTLRDRQLARRHVYPRTYFPIQMRDENRVVPAKRFFRDDAEQADDPTALDSR
jgi:hypothetical protein